MPVYWTNVDSLVNYKLHTKHNIEWWWESSLDIEVNNYKPLKMGAILKTPRPPIVSICPRANSMKNIGIPARINVMKYLYKNKIFYLRKINYLNDKL